MNPTKNKRLHIVIFFHLFASSLFAMEFWMPVIDGPWWQAAGNPDLGQYTSDKQQPVDFALWQAADGTWQLWSCIRFTKLGGHTRLFYRWEGKHLTDTDWTPKGIAMMADPALGEPLGGLQAPHVVKYKRKYWMAYGDWDNIRLAISKDGKTFKRLTQAGVIFTEGPYVNNRDPMLLFTRDKWHCYYTAFPAERGYVYCRTSDDLLKWSEPVIAGYGGVAGSGPYSCECPHVVEVAPGHYFLFRTQYYGPGARTSVYHSQNPQLFGIDNDSGYVTQMNLCAPEIVRLDGRYYIAALNPDLDGVRIARLKWKSFTRPVFDFDSPAHRAQWKQTEGDLASVFTNSRRGWFNPQTDYFIATAETEPPAFDDARMGILESPVFTIRTPECIVYVSGGNDPQRLYVAVVDARTDQEYLRVTGQDSNLLRPVLVDCQPFQDKPVKVRIADRSQEPWGHINFGGLVEHTPDKDR
jgi:hypothetical protein